MIYLRDNYFNKDQYLKYTDNNPIMLLWPSSKSESSLQTPSGLNSRLQTLGLDNVYVYMEFRNPAFTFNADNTNTYDNLGVFNWIYPQKKSSDKMTQIDQVIYDNNHYYDTVGGSYYNSKFYIGSLIHGFSDHYILPGTATTDPYNALGFINSDYGYINILYEQTYNNNDNGNYPYIIPIPTWNDYSEGTIIEPNIATSGCTQGCAGHTASNPYTHLIEIYKLFVDSNANDVDVQQALEAITKQYFPDYSESFISNNDEKNHTNTAIIVAVICVIAVLLIAGTIFVYYWKKKKNGKASFKDSDVGKDSHDGM